MCARCEVDIGSKMSKTERRESENFFFFFLRKSQFAVVIITMHDLRAKNQWTRIGTICKTMKAAGGRTCSCINEIPPYFIHKINRLMDNEKKRYEVVVFSTSL